MDRKRFYRLTPPWLLGLSLTAGSFALVGLLVLNNRAIEHRAQAAQVAVAAGRTTQARGLLHAWLRARPSSAEAHALLAEVALSDGDFAAVQHELEAARSLGCAEPKLERIRALLSARAGRYAEAEAVLARLWTENAGPDAAVDEALARIYLKTYRLRRASAVIQRWINDSPADGRPIFWLTEIDRRTAPDNPALCESHYRQALDRDPDLAPARLGLAESLRKIHRNEEAGQEYEYYLSRHPDDAAALSGAGRNAFELGDFARAAQLLDRALEVAPADPEALRWRAEMEVNSGDPAAARRRLDQALQADPFDAEAFHIRAQVRRLLGDTPGAADDRAAFERLKKDQAELLAMRGRLLDHPADNDTRSRVVEWCFAHGRDQDALEWAMAILASDPNHASTCRLLAEYYRKRPDRAGLANFYRFRADSQVAAPK
jgi:tetratricopeptide (TPR) repeat protein